MSVVCDIRKYANKKKERFSKTDVNFKHVESIETSRNLDLLMIHDQLFLKLETQSIIE